MDQAASYHSKMGSDLKKVKDEVLRCKKCQLYKTRIHPVIGQGNHQAKICLIGEAPGANEDKTGWPFCGQAGKVLDELLDSTGIKREEIYITNILKCRPPGNRNPLKNEIDACSDYLLRQLVIIKPEAICCLGNFATQFIMEKFDLSDKVASIGRIHGQAFSASRKGYGQLHIIPLYHPAAVTYNIGMKETLIKDFRILKRF